ncbi:MAG TPA: terminase family protein, partial [Candidatus Glassbacteria bacterium]|nr:terminase family protein [Candidatus Glassbacteria bacterium]
MEEVIVTKDDEIQVIADEYVSEYLKCKNSFEYFCENYILIEVPGQDALLKPYQKQKELIHLVEEKRYVLVLKSRQIGISTIIQAYAAWLAVFFDNAVIGIISKDGKEATDFARAIRGMVEKLPDWMKPPKGPLGKGFAKRTEQSFILTNGSKVYASPVNPNAPDKTLRGKAITFLVIDEAAFVHHVDTAWTSMVPALSTNQMQAKKAGVPYGTVVLSTPNKTMGVGQWYFNRYTKSISRDDIFEPFVIHWKMIPELAEDPDWYKTQCRLFDHDQRKIAQELELKFLPSEGSFFEPETVEKVQNAVKIPMEIMRIFNGELWKFSNTLPNRYYIMGVDTAPEHGEDKSAITVWDYETMEQVAEYQGKCKVL